MAEFNRRSLILGVGALFAAPAVVRASSLMPVRTPIIMREAVHYYICTAVGITADGLTVKASGIVGAARNALRFTMEPGHTGIVPGTLIRVVENASPPTIWAGQKP